MALGFLLILSTAAMPRPHCLRERCVSELLLLTLMCVCVCVSTAGPIFLSRVVFDDYQWKWCHERRRKRETLKLSWNAAVTSIRRSFFTFIFARDAEDKRATVLANAEDSRFSLRVTVLACISRFHDNFFVVRVSFWHRTVFSLLHRCASSSSVHERQTETMERRIPKN